MVRSSCCDVDRSLKKGPWTPDEDQKLVGYITRNGHGSWKALPKLAGLNRCGKSCRLRWTNYLRPDIKRGRFSEEEERIIINLHSVLGNKWSIIASHLPGRTDNEIKNFWNTHIRKKLLQMGIDPVTHKPRTDLNNLMEVSPMIFSSPFANLMSRSSSTSAWDINTDLKLQTDATQLAKIQLLQNVLQLMNCTTNSFLRFENNNNSCLLGLQNVNPFQSNGLMVHATMNPDSTTQAISDNPWAQSNSWSSFEGGLEMEGLDASNNSSYIQQENKLPPLISASSKTSSISKMEKESSEIHRFLTSSDPISSNSETLEKFMSGDETCESYWKKILDSTWSPSSPDQPGLLSM